MKPAKDGKGDGRFDRFVRETLEARGASATPGPCLDAETLAAWADRALTSAERAAAEAHAADCARCQALLAAMAKTSASPAGVRVWRRRPALAWAVPLAAAAALVLWIAIPTSRQEVVDNVRVARVEPPPAQPPAAAPPSAVGPGEARPPDQARLPVSADERRAAKLPRRDAPGQRRAEEAGAPPSAPVASPKATEEKADALADRVQSVAKARAPLPAAPLVGAVTTSVTASAATPVVEIVSSNPGSRWRIVEGGAVQRSMDGGSTWHMQQTGVTVRLTAGASPSPSVCWLVGPNGIVVLSIDGRTWQRVAFPETTDLTGIRATDHKTATVTTADNRVFSTTDGGLTWTPGSVPE